MPLIGELWLADFGEPFPNEPAHHRPLLIVGPSSVMGPSFPLTVVVPLTTTRRSQLIHVEIEADDRTGLDYTSYAQCELVRSVSKQRLVHRLGVVSPGLVGDVDTALRAFLGH